MSAARGRARSARMHASIDEMIADELELRMEAQQMHEDEIERWHAYEHDMIERARVEMRQLDEYEHGPRPRAAARRISYM